MKLAELRKIWNSRDGILEGVRNRVFKKKHIEEIFRQRLGQCRTCEHFDADGSSPQAYVKGEPACRICGCNLNLKARCLSCACALTSPRWEAVLTAPEEVALLKSLEKKS